MLQIISSDNLELDMANSCCQFVFTKEGSKSGTVEYIDSINGSFEVSGQKRPEKMDLIGFEHEMDGLESKFFT